LLASIREKKSLTDEIKADLKQALEDFKHMRNKPKQAASSTLSVAPAHEPAAAPVAAV